MYVLELDTKATLLHWLKKSPLVFIIIVFLFGAGIYTTLRLAYKGIRVLTHKA
jgi:hypothetical protein